MKKVVILGAGISGHTAALVLSRRLKQKHKIIVITPNAKWNWIPSNIWVGVGLMSPEDVTFELKPIYSKLGIEFHQAKAVEIYPEGSNDTASPFVKIESTLEESKGSASNIAYDYLINATGPKLNFDATPGLGPNANSFSVCTFAHAAETAKALDKLVEQMRKGDRKIIVIGTGHGLCTCEGAAFEYVFNLEFELRHRGVRDMADLIFLTNEATLGDFGVGGLQFQSGGYITPSEAFAKSLFVERNICWIVGAHVHKVNQKDLEYETLDGEKFVQKFDFAMLLPPFSGVPLKAFDKAGNDLKDILFAPSGFTKVDADYTAKKYEEWQPSDWPKTYQTKFSNIFAVGIAFAPPHQISKPMKTKNGTMIAPAPPRTGMPSAIIGRAVANSIADMIEGKSDKPTMSASMADLGAACIASAGANLYKGTAASMTMYPIVPDYKKYPIYGRSLRHTSGEVGLAGHWIKSLLHYAFIYKAKARPFWWVIPE